MEKSLFRFIWKYSKKDQLLLLAVTLLTFPILYISLELPKRIINDAIGGTGADVLLLGISLTQVQFLIVLCIGFLVAVLVNGLLKMRLNTMKGVLAERLLRRFRFQLITRILRFPRAYFRTTSQGELVSMVTSEAEPLGGLMGDMVAQPVFQAGQMLTILAFLFTQSIWFGLASIALIPLQAWVIPKLQRQINLLNKERIKEVRKLASDIGETAAGVSDIRTNGGLRYRMSMFSNRLGNLFGIRFEIYQKKFFMKFLNNFINQLTPFFFYAVGGYLAIIGEITVGALVAALAAYKDLSSPWKELLTYYNLTQDMALRWETVTERFSSQTLAEDVVYEGSPKTIPDLSGDIELQNITVRDETGNTILEDINMTIPQGATVAIETSSEEVASTLGDVFTREVIPYRGTMRIAGQPLSEMHQVVVSSRIGYAHAKPQFFRGTLADNLLMPFRQEPSPDAKLSNEMVLRQKESNRSGNNADPFDIDWVAPQMTDPGSEEEIREWWFQLTEAMGTDDMLVRRALRIRLQPGTQPELEEAIVNLRPEIAERLREDGLDDLIARFDPEKFNPVSPLGSNLLYALPSKMLTQETLSKEPHFVRMLKNLGIESEIARMSTSLIEGLTDTFGTDGIDHPLFRRLNMEDEVYHRLGAIMTKRRALGEEGLSTDEYALMLTVPFAFSAEQFGPVFSEEFKERVLHIRKTSSKKMVAELDGLFETIDPQRYIPVMTVLGNGIFGRILSVAGAREKMIEDTVVNTLNDHGLRRLAAQCIFDFEISQGGDNMATMFKERAAFNRASIKKPDILVLNNALGSHDKSALSQTHARIDQLMPGTTKVFVEKQFEEPELYDLHIRLVNGRMEGTTSTPEPKDQQMRHDLRRKLKMVAQAELFENLDIKQQRLLAFSSQWYEAKAGQTIFSMGEEADAAYLCTDGLSGLYWSMPDEESRLVMEITPGRLIGDLAVMVNEPRQLDLVAIEDSQFLRIGVEELMAVIENDVHVASSLLKSVSVHLNNVSNNLRSIRNYAVERGVDFTDFEP
ncbi:MAG: cyclic nucleotide-binding domain-containing protein [Acidiferrobacterales bacterium]|nr:cyclic nucleotide-binding domain-containing protein [Acidiferrobacterales bacterium]